MPRELATTKQYREQRTQKCMEYLRKYGSLPAARKAANRIEMFQANTSAWLTALGRILKEQGKPQGVHPQQEQEGR